MRLERSSVFQSSLIGVEVTEGTAVSATKRLLSVGFTPSPIVPIEPYAPAGFLAPTTAVVQKEHAEGAIEGRLDFNTVIYMLAGNVSADVITTPAGATNTRRHTFKPLTTNINNPNTFTLEQGGDAGGERINGALFNSLTFRVTEEESAITGTIYGRQVQEGIVVTGNEVQKIDLAGATGGTYTLTYSGQTTAAIQWNATAAAVQAALEALSNLAPGDVVVTLVSAGIYQVEFRGTLAQTNVAQITITSSLTGGGTASVTTTQAGTAITDIAVQPVGPTQPSVFFGETLAAEVQTIDLGGPSAGTFTLSFQDPFSSAAATTAAIAFNAADTTVQTALRALSTVGLDGATVTGSAGGPYTVTFTGRLAGLNLNLITVDGAGLTGGAPTVVQTTAGGLTQLDRCYEWEFTIADRFQFGYTLDATQPSYSHRVEARPNLSSQIVVQHDATSQAFMAIARTGQVRYLRFVALGVATETGFRHRIQFTYPVLIGNPERSDRNGVWASQYDMIPVHHATLGSFMEVVVDNLLTAL